MSADTLWYKDAVFYELHVKAFQDSSGDRVGHFGGLIQRLDYVRDLGMDVIWLLPFLPSPLRDRLRHPRPPPKNTNYLIGHCPNAVF